MTLLAALASLAGAALFFAAGFVLKRPREATRVDPGVEDRLYLAEQSLASAQQDAARAQAELERAHAAAASAEEASATEQRAAADARAQADAARRETAAAGAELTKRDAALAEAQKRVQRLEGELGAVRSSLAGWEAKTQEVTQAKNEAAVVQAENQRLARELKDLQNHTAMLASQQKESAARELAEARRVVEQLRRERDEIAQRMTSGATNPSAQPAAMLENELTRLRRENKALSTQVRALGGRPMNDTQTVEVRETTETTVVPFPVSALEGD